MRTPICLSVLSLIIATSSLFAQGWQSVGPDSVNWQNVQRLSIKWTSPTDYRIAATTTVGISVCSASSQWTYPLRNFEGNQWFPAFYYLGYEFFPWETDSVYLFMNEQWLEPGFRLLKVPLSGGPSRPIGFSGCWFTPFNMVFSSRADSVAWSSSCGLYRSSDKGITWETVLAVNAASASQILFMDDAPRRTVYIGVYNKLYISEDQGSSLDSILHIPIHVASGQSPFSVYARGDSILIAATTSPFDTSHAFGIYRSTNAGATWTRTYSSGRAIGIARSSVSPSSVFAATEEGILRSTTFGATWSEHNNALPTTRLTDLLISPSTDTMFVSTETHGVLKVWNYLTHVDVGTNHPLKFELMQNYPNPCNPTTTIKFHLPAPSGADGQAGIPNHKPQTLVTLKVFDLLGREVATLVNEGMKPGSYERVFDGNGLASGVYLYQLKTDRSIQTKKLLLVR